MVSSNEADLNLRERMLLSRNNLHSMKWINGTANGPVRWSFEFRKASGLNQSLRQIHLNYSVSVRDTAMSGKGCKYNRHLNYFAEFIPMNVGGSRWNAKTGSQSMASVSVGATIVVRDRESLSHGEGSQFVGTSRANVTECQNGGISDERR